MTERISFAQFRRRAFLIAVPLIAMVITAVVALIVWLKLGTREALDAATLARGFLVACVVGLILVTLEPRVKRLFHRYPLGISTVAYVAVGALYASGGVEGIMFGSAVRRDSYTWHGFVFGIPILLMGVWHFLSSRRTAQPGLRSD